MSDRPQLRTVVADTSALVSLAVPRADSAYDTNEKPDPLQYLLTSCDVTVPPEVIAELQDITQYQDIHGAAASNVLAAETYYAVEDPYDSAETPDSRPTFGLDDGETDGIVLANTRGVDGLLTDEFGGTNFALVHAALQGPRIVPTPRLLCDYARNGHLTADEANALIETIAAHRSWENSPYVTQLLGQLEQNRS
jgi:predicted nucleic acid-binding protein